jgi:hypothetical protein
MKIVGEWHRLFVLSRKEISILGEASYQSEGQGKRDFSVSENHEKTGLATRET